MSDDTAQVSALVGYTADEAGLASQLSALVGFTPDDVGFASQLATLVGYRYPVATDTARANVYNWSSTPSVADSYFFSGSFVAGEEA